MEIKENIVVGDEIMISSDLWRFLNKSYSRDKIKALISNAIEDHQIPMPMAFIAEEDAKADFLKLKELDSGSIIKKSEWFTRYDYLNKKTNLVVGASNVGNKSSNYFHQENRWRCDSINSPSPYRSWYIEKFRLTLLNALWSLKVDKVDSSTLRSCIGLRKYIASQFRPSAAKAFYEMFESEHVYDPSSGWGDRLSGFYAAAETKSYTSVDPNSNLFTGYADQTEFLRGLSKEHKEVIMSEGCAEDFIPERTFDTVFTSPPYFNIERYTQDDTQSFKKYRRLEDWLNGFLFKMLGTAWERLESGGTLGINISDVYSNHTVNRICDPMNSFIASLPDSHYYGCYGYEMRKRPNSGALKGKHGAFAEPIWVWKKR